MVDKFWNYDIEDNAFTLMKDDKGVIASLHSTATQWEHRFRFEITLEKALLEFKYVVHRLKSKSSKLNYREIKLLSRANHNLAVSYAKKKWYIEAMAEARNAFNLFPTDENRKVLELIQAKEISTKSALKKHTIP